jgi:hypothetical protein
MSHPRTNAIRSGALMDLTHGILGRKAAAGTINVACSRIFFDKILRGQLAGEYLKRLMFLMRTGEFTFKDDAREFKCRCVHKREMIEGVDVSCFTFFTMSEQNDY